MAGGICKAKARRSQKHKMNKKFERQFARTVKRTGRWRGKRFNPLTLMPVK